MKALIKYERRTPRERAVYRGMKLAFATLAVVLLVVFGSAMSVQAYRYRFVEFIVEVLEDLTSYSVQEKAPTGETADLVEPGYVPKGYIEINRVENNKGCSVLYEDKCGERIAYKQDCLSLSVYFWDTETSVVNTTYLGQQKVNIIEENDMRVIYWADEAYAYCITGTKPIELDELLKMAYSIIE